MFSKYPDNIPQFISLAQSLDFGQYAVGKFRSSLSVDLHVSVARSQQGLVNILSSKHVSSGQMTRRVQYVVEITVFQ